MSSDKSFLKVLPVALALLLVAPAWTRPTAVGPPWISVEMPANPLDQTTRGAALLVHAFHHASQVSFPVSGSAEGIVNGERRSVPLEFSRTSRSGVYALQQQWPSEGHWVLAISVGVRGKADVSLLVELGPDGGVKEGTYFRMPTKILSTRSMQIVRGPIEGDKIEAALQRMMAMSED